MFETTKVIKKNNLIILKKSSLDLLKTNQVNIKKIVVISLVMAILLIVQINSRGMYNSLSN